MVGGKSGCFFKIGLKYETILTLLFKIIFKFPAGCFLLQNNRPLPPTIYNINLGLSIALQKISLLELTLVIELIIMGTWSTCQYFFNYLFYSVADN